ncbi:polyprenyl synthetase family protein [Nocardioides sp. KR10-350]|uniref:polyprenyl synthetase family protein n=1 Tax=Nocardioides cheoyonin TaxID=3156615 RepID=UPI0032B4D860
MSERLRAAIGTTSAREWLTTAKGLWDPGLRAAVDRLDPHMRRVAAYHFGWVDADGNPSDGSAGKGLRPGLALLAAEALTAGAAPRPDGPGPDHPGPDNPALPGAVAVELVHNFSLVHDDLIDRDEARHHRPTVWTVWDDTTAILVGDAMLSLAHEELGLAGATGGSSYAVAAGLALTAATRELIRGQAEDVIFESRDDVTLEDCLGMVAGKTGSLLAVSASIGAILAGADQKTVDGFHTFGFELGLAFQIVDDLLGIWGATEVTGKPVFADLAAAKKTLPVVWSLDHGCDAGEQLREWFARRTARSQADTEELQYAADLIEKAGGRAWAAEQADAHVSAALAALEDLPISDDGRATLTDLAHFVTERKS